MISRPPRNDEPDSKKGRIFNSISMMSRQDVSDRLAAFGRISFLPYAGSRAGASERHIVNDTDRF